jgi:hypothetical protein
MPVSIRSRRQRWRMVRERREGRLWASIVCYRFVFFMIEFCFGDGEEG